MDNKFRNHPSLMLEQLGVFGVIIITFLISSLDWQLTPLFGIRLGSR